MDSSKSQHSQDPTSVAGSSRKRKLPNEEEENVDITGLSTQNKRLQTESSNNEKTASIIPQKMQQFFLVNDIIDYHNKNEKYPYSDDDDLQEFYEGWYKGRGVYDNMVELSNKMYKLHSIFVKNMKNEIKYNPEWDKGLEPIDFEIFDLSCTVFEHPDITESLLTGSDADNENEGNDNGDERDSNYQPSTETDEDYEWSSVDSNDV